MELLDYLFEILITKEESPEYPDKTSPAHLCWMLKEMKNNESLRTDKFKFMRWLGFIQGVMCARGWLSVDEERDRTRSYFTKNSSP